MKPWKLRIDWICHDAYGDPIEVWLHVMGRRPQRLRQFSSVPRAIDWALRYMNDRGCEPNVVKVPDRARDHGFVMHAVPSAKVCQAES